jgi:UPF0176 protein
MIFSEDRDSNKNKSEQNQGEDRRITISFYRYVRINEPVEIRNKLYSLLEKLNCLGRIYVSSEGINAQMSLPESGLENFRCILQDIEFFSDMYIKYAIDENANSFSKLVVKTRNKIVADGLDNDSYDFTNTGRHLTPMEFHSQIGQPDTILIDMRNHYESEIGHFKGAILPQTDTFRETIQIVTQELQSFKDKKILMYCTGGIRCEKASAYMKHLGFTDVNQLQGGIIGYTREIKQERLESKFIGKNFVFDERLGEAVTEDIISTCYQCGKKCDSHTNCANNFCHLLFIQCKDCALKYSGCCSEECNQSVHNFKDKNLCYGFLKLEDKTYRKGIKRTESVLIKTSL